MKQFGRQLHNESKSVKLRAVERAELKDRLQMYMEYHPLPQTQQTVSKQEKITSEPFWAVPFNTIYTRVAVGVCSVLVLVGVPVAAEQAVPGDMLYPVKIQVNEEVRSSLAFSTHEKIAWETERLERRIEEVRTLASQGRLTEDIDSAVAQAVHEHSQAAQQEIAALRSISEEEAALAELTFASSLAMQSEMFERTVTNDTSRSHTSKVLAAVQNEEKEANERSESGEQPSYESLMARLEQETTMASELFASIRGAASADEVEKIERRLSDVRDKMQKAQQLQQAPTETTGSAVASVAAESASTSATSSVTKSTTTGSTTGPATTARSETAASSGQQSMTADADVDVVPDTNDGTASATVLRGALRDVQKLISFMSDITIRETVSLEDWIPVTLSTEERIDNLQALLRNIKRIQALIEKQDSDTETPEKVQLHKQQVLENILQIESLLQSDDIAAAETLVKETHALAIDLETLLQATTTTPDASNSEATSTPATTTNPAATSSATNGSSTTVE